MKKLSLLIILSSLSLFANRLEYNTDKPGHDYRVVSNISSALMCQAVCDGEEPCKSWTFVKPNTIQGPTAHCYLKNSNPGNVENNSCISGVSIATFDEVRRVILNHRLEFYASRKNLKDISSEVLPIISALIRSNDSKLIIFIKPKNAGLAKRRVKALKNYFSEFGVNPSKYSITTARAYSTNHRPLRETRQLIIDLVPR